MIALACSSLRACRTGLAFVALAGLLACGGGGAEDPPSGPSASAPSPAATSAAAAAAPTPASTSAAAPTPPATSAAPAPAPATAAVVAGTRLTCGLANFEADALALVNAHRAAGASCGSSGDFGAAAPLAWNAALTQAAIVHSEDMMANNFFSHTGSSGSSASQRATAAGYAWRGYGENIAAGQASVAKVVAGWMASPGHCANVMKPGFKDIGLACVSGGASNAYRSYWTMTLGTLR